VIKNVAQKIQKCNHLKIDVWCLWNVKTEVILKIIRKIPEQQLGKAGGYQGTT